MLVIVQIASSLWQKNYMSTKHCAAGLLLRAGSILLVKRTADRAFYTNVWDLPGGHCHDSEAPSDTLLRELLEELNISPVDFKHLATLTEPNEEAHGKYEYHVFLVTSWQGEIENLCPDEHSLIEWVKIEDAEDFSLAHPDYLRLFSELAER